VDRTSTVRGRCLNQRISIVCVDQLRSESISRSSCSRSHAPARYRNIPHFSPGNDNCFATHDICLNHTEHSSFRSCCWRSSALARLAPEYPFIPPSLSEETSLICHWRAATDVSLTMDLQNDDPDLLLSICPIFLFHPPFAVLVSGTVRLSERP